MTDNHFNGEHGAEQRNFGVSPRAEGGSQENIWADFDVIIAMARKPIAKSQMSEAGGLRHGDKPKTEPGKNTTSPTRRVSSFVPGTVLDGMTSGDHSPQIGKNENIPASVCDSTDGCSTVQVARAELLPTVEFDPPTEAGGSISADNVANEAQIRTVGSKPPIAAQQSSSENPSPLMSNSSQEDVKSMGMTSPQVDEWLAGTHEHRRYLSPVDQEFHRMSPIKCNPMHRPSPAVENLRLYRDENSPIGRQQSRYPPSPLPISPAVDRLFRYQTSPIRPSGLIGRTDVANCYPIGCVGNPLRSQLPYPNSASGLPVFRVQPSYCSRVERPRSSGERQSAQVRGHISDGTLRPGSSMESRETISPRRANVLSTPFGQRANHRRHRRPRGAATFCALETPAHAPVTVEEVDQQTAGTNETGVNSLQPLLKESTDDSESSTFVKVERASNGNSDCCEMELLSVSSFEELGNSSGLKDSGNNSTRIYDLDELNDDPRVMECEESVQPSSVKCGTMVVSNPRKKGRVRRTLTHLQKGLRRVGRRFLDLFTACTSM